MKNKKIIFIVSILSILAFGITKPMTKKSDYSSKDMELVEELAKFNALDALDWLGTESLFAARDTYLKVKKELKKADKIEEKIKKEIKFEETKVKTEAKEKTKEVKKEEQKEPKKRKFRFFNRKNKRMRKIEKAIKRKKNKPMNAGIYNEEKYCGVNAVLQCLSKSGFPIFKNLFTRLKDSSEPIYLFKEELNILDELLKEEKEPDVVEFLNKLFNKCKKDGLLKNKDSSFYIKFKKSKIPFDYKFALQLDIFNPFFKILGNKGYQKVVFHNTSKSIKELLSEKIISKGTVKKSPKTLILFLNRFYFDESTATLIKDKNCKIELDEYLYDRKNDLRHSLIGLVLHLGEKKVSGSYIAIIKQDDKFYIYNNEKVSEPMSLDNALERTKEFDPYILFYRKESNIGKLSKKYTIKKLEDIQKEFEYFK
ncbi:hypothetical protein GF385_03905 [Candidatus Dependentiae bacterium]|nr:hypothetical protein [Candidatus Dependentiae bacterium]